MKKLVNILLILTFGLFLGYSSFPSFLERVGNTQLNGEGCVCHTLLTPSPEVFVRVEGPDSLQTGETGIYKMFLAGGVAVGGGYNIAARFGTLGLTDTLSILLGGEITQSFGLPFPTMSDTIFWEFSYTAPNSEMVDTIYSAGLTTDMDGDPLTNDFWNFGPKFPVIVYSPDVPVELRSFTANVNENNVILNWSTASEKNNMGFEVQKTDTRNQMTEWKVVGFVNGNGTTTELNNYYFNDNNVREGTYYYRLKQIDYDGSFEFSSLVEIEVNNSMNFTLSQNYPNPFNPSTTIQYSIPNVTLGLSKSDILVSLKVFDVLGNEIATLVNEQKSAGNYEVNWNASEQPSGIYYYQLNISGESVKFSETKKMLLLK